MCRDALKILKIETLLAQTRDYSTFVESQYNQQHQDMFSIGYVVIELLKMSSKFIIYIANYRL